MVSDDRGVSAGNFREASRSHQVITGSDVRADDTVLIKEGNDGANGLIGLCRGRAEGSGTAQIHGLRGDTDIAERIRYDIWYIENWTVALDIKIIFRTVFGGKMVNDEKLQ